MPLKWIIRALLVGSLLPAQATAQAPLTPWRDDAMFQRLAAALDPVMAIDLHSHLLEQWGAGRKGEAAESARLLDEPYRFVGGADVQHIVLSRSNRDALYLALAGFISDGVIDELRAVEMGRGVLRENARRLHGWNQSGEPRRAGPTGGAGAP